MLLFPMLQIPLLFGIDGDVSLSQVFVNVCMIYPQNKTKQNKTKQNKQKRFPPKTFRSHKEKQETQVSHEQTTNSNVSTCDEIVYFLF